MIYPNLHAILATRVDGLIGDGDLIPWHHSGDLKYFKATTMNAALIIGFKTLAGIAKNYFKNGREVLPGRRLYVAYDDRGQSPAEVFDEISKYGNFNKTNFYHLPDRPSSLEAVMRNELGEVFIAGGAKTYQRYMPYAANVYMTLITQKVRPDYYNPVYLTTDIQHALFNRDVGMDVIRPSEHDGDVIADYFKISKLSYGGVGDGFSEF